MRDWHIDEEQYLIINWSRTEAVKGKTFLALTPAVQHPLAEDTNPDDQFNLYWNRM